MTAKVNANEASEEKKSINRREFLNIAWLASLGILTVSIGGATYLFAMPRFKEGEFGGLFTIGTVADLPPVGSEPVNYPKVKLWLSRTEEGISPLYKVCTHLGCLYNWNTQEGKFLCPCHGSQFQIDGQYVQGPAPRSLDLFVIQAVDPNTGEVIAQSDGSEPLPVPDDPNVIIQVDTGKRVQGERHS